jgi:hypothetical protein
MRIWKHLVYDTIRKYELSEWTQRLNDDDEFDSFKSIHQVYQLHPAWTVALSHPHLRKQAFLVSFRKFFSDNTRVRIFFLSRKTPNFFPVFIIRLYDKYSESDYFFFLHQHQNIFFGNIGNQNIFLEKNHNPPFKLNGRSLIILEYWINSQLLDYLSFFFASILINCIFLLIVTFSFDILFVQLYSPNGGK